MSGSAATWKHALGSLAGAWLLTLMRWSWRIDGDAQRHVRDRRARCASESKSDGRSPGMILLHWHSRILIGAATHHDLGICVLISRHGDGEYIAQTVERMGNVTARGSSTRGGARALKALIDHLASGGDVAITPDGPKGPALRVQLGCIEAASITGAAIVPMGLACRSCKRLRSWDRFVVPWFFTKVVQRWGEEIRVPPDLDAAGLETWRLRVEDALRAVTEEAERVAGMPHESAALRPPKT